MKNILIVSVLLFSTHLWAADSSDKNAEPVCKVNESGACAQTPIKTLPAVKAPLSTSAAQIQAAQKKAKEQKAKQSTQEPATNR